MPVINEQLLMIRAKRLIKEGWSVNEIYNALEKQLRIPVILSLKRSVLRERLYVDVDCSKINYNVITYDSVKDMILAGENIDELSENMNEMEKKKILDIMRELEIVALNSQKDAEGKLVPDEKMVELLKMVHREPKTTMGRIKAELKLNGVCSEGTIDKIVNNIFDGNKYTSYYVLRKMEHAITFDEAYDKKVYDNLKKETEEALTRIVAPLKRLEMAKNTKYLEGK